MDKNEPIEITDPQIERYVRKMFRICYDIGTELYDIVDNNNIDPKDIREHVSNVLINSINEMGILRQKIDCNKEIPLNERMHIESGIDILVRVLFEFLENDFADVSSEEVSDFMNEVKSLKNETLGDF